MEEKIAKVLKRAETAERNATVAHQGKEDARAEVTTGRRELEQLHTDHRA
ncbi:hypothetical protein ACIBI7_50405 [Nonomuraea fuscirosea]